MTTRFDAFDKLVAARETNDRVCAVIESALTNIRHDADADGYAGDALRLRGASVLLATAAHEIAMQAGALELAAAVSDSGILDEEHDG